MILAQVVSPEQATGWLTWGERAGMAGLAIAGLILTLVAVHRRWYLPGWVYVEMRDVMAKENAQLRTQLDQTQATLDRLLNVQEQQRRR